MELSEKDKAYMVAVEANSAGYDAYVGHTSDALGYGWEAYCDWAHAIIEEMNPDEEGGIGTFQTYKQWVAMQRDANDSDDLGFSHANCDLCNDLAGDRYAATLIDKVTGVHFAISICNLCMCYIANGELPNE